MAHGHPGAPVGPYQQLDLADLVDVAEQIIWAHEESALAEGEAMPRPCRSAAWPLVSGRVGRRWPDGAPRSRLSDRGRRASAWSRTPRVAAR